MLFCAVDRDRVTVTRVTKIIRIPHQKPQTNKLYGPLNRKKTQKSPFKNSIHAKI